MRNSIPKSWGLKQEQIERLYAVEVEQSNKLRRAQPDARRKMYTSVYEEYFQQLPFHPQLTLKRNEDATRDRVEYQLRQVMPFIKGCERFVEVGAGDCSLSKAVSAHCNEVIALEVSSVVSGDARLPANVKLVLFDGFKIPLPDNNVDVVYSNQLMEHLHPDDAMIQLGEIYRILKNGGVYICITPNRITGPHDISRFFTDKPVGFHLREYSSGDLRSLFLSSGFSNVIFYNILKGKKIGVPFLIVGFVEWILENLPITLRTNLLKFFLIRFAFNAMIGAVK